jgi:hypothetical protein
VRVVVSFMVTQDLGILWWALQKYKSYDNRTLEAIRASLLMYLCSEVDCTRCYFGYMHLYLLYT